MCEHCGVGPECVVCGRDGAAMGVLHTFTNPADGLESRVIRNVYGIGVILADTDAGRALPIIKGFATEAAAIAYARQIVA